MTISPPKPLTTALVGEAVIRPFRVEVPDSELEDLRAHRRNPLPREGARRRPHRAPVGEHRPAAGRPAGDDGTLVRYPGTEYDLGRVEARLNALAQFLLRSTASISTSSTSSRVMRTRCR